MMHSAVVDAHGHDAWMDAISAARGNLRHVDLEKVQEERRRKAEEEKAAANAAPAWANLRNLRHVVRRSISNNPLADPSAWQAPPANDNL